MVGHEEYDKALSGQADFDTPEWKNAFGYVQQLAEHKCVNESVNAIDDNEGAQLFFQGKAAMHAIGSWLVSWAIDEAPDLDFDFVNLAILPMFLLSATFFPLSEYPDGVQWLVRFTPLYQGVVLERAFVFGELDWTLLLNALYLVVLGTVGLAVGGRRLRALLLP